LLFCFVFKKLYRTLYNLQKTLSFFSDLCYNLYVQGIWQKINYQKNKIKGSDNILDKAKAVVFVDYEYLHITFEKVFSRELDFDFLKKKLEEMYDLVAIVTFADFTCESFSRVLHKIRDFSTFVNECANPLAFSKKDQFFPD